MELSLNLVWIAVAVCACACWRRFPAETLNRAACFNQIVALLMLVLVLFPVISLTDDFQAATFPAETEGVARRMAQAVHVPVPLAVTAVRTFGAEWIARDPEPRLFVGLDEAAPVHLQPWVQAAATRPPPVV